MDGLQRLLDAMSDVFISYAREDQSRAEAIAHALEREGWSVWWDRNIRAGKRFPDVIEEQIGKARCILVLWSTVSIKSDWVIDEAEEGKERGILVPVFLESVRPPRGFRQVEAADLVDWGGDAANAAFRRLCEDIRELVRTPKGDPNKVLAAETTQESVAEAARKAEQERIALEQKEAARKAEQERIALEEKEAAREGAEAQRKAEEEQRAREAALAKFKQARFEWHRRAREAEAERRAEEEQRAREAAEAKAKAEYRSAREAKVERWKAKQSQGRVGATGIASAVQNLHRCPKCGARVGDGIIYCFECRSRK